MNYLFFVRRISLTAVVLIAACSSSSPAVGPTGSGGAGGSPAGGRGGSSTGGASGSSAGSGSNTGGTAGGFGGSNGGAGGGGNATGGSGQCLGFNINVPATTVSGTVTVSGAAIPSTSNDAGDLTLRNAAGDTALIASTKTGTTTTYSALVVPGTYDLYYTNSATIYPTAVPRNTLADLGCFVVPPN